MCKIFSSTHFYRVIRVSFIKILFFVFLFFNFLNSNANIFLSVPDTIRVCDFGAVGDGLSDDTQALQQAFQAFTSSEYPAVLLFQKDAFYKITETPDRWHHFEITGKKNLTIRGNGATLVSTPTNHFFSIVESENIRICDLYLDYNPLPFTQGKITSVNIPDGYYEMEILPGFPGNITDYFYARSGNGFNGWSHTVIIDAQTRCRNEDMITDHMYIDNASAIGVNSFRIYVAEEHVKNLPYLKTGNISIIGLGFLFNKNFDEVKTMRGEGLGWVSNIFINKCKNVEMRKIRQYSCPGRAYRVTDNTGPISISGCEIRPKPDTDREVVTIIDGIHTKHNTGPVIIDSCHVQGTMDDLINCHLLEDLITDIGTDGALSLSNLDNVNSSYNMDIGNELMFIKPYQGVILGTANVASLVKIGRSRFNVTLNRGVEGLTSGKKTDENITLVMNYGRSGAGFRISNNLLIPLLRRALGVTWTDGVIENNVLDCRGGGAIWAQNIQDNYAGPFPRNLIIQNNKIINSSLASIMLGATWGTGVKTPVQFESNSVIRNNTIITNKKAINHIQIKNMQQIDVEDNTVYIPEVTGGEKVVSLTNSTLRLNRNNNVFSGGPDHVETPFDSKAVLMWNFQEGKLVIRNAIQGKLSIYTLDGSLNYNEKVNDANQISLPQLPKGIYVARLISGTECYSVKILK